MKIPNRIVLQIGWAYPPSPNAKGFPKGCYVIEMTTLDGTDAETRTLSGRFPVMQDACEQLAKLERMLRAVERK